MGVGILLGTKSILTNPGLQIVVVFVLSGFCLFATLALLYYCTNESVRLVFYRTVCDSEFSDPRSTI